MKGKKRQLTVWIGKAWDGRIESIMPQTPKGFRLAEVIRKGTKFTFVYLLGP